MIRLWNSDVLANPEGAAEYILAQAAECLGGTHPQPGAGPVIPRIIWIARGAIHPAR